MAHCELCKCFKYFKLNVSQINTEMKWMFGIWFKKNEQTGNMVQKEEWDKSLGSNLNEIQRNDYLIV